ncbi:hypothetical protein GCM10011396_50100 [Undibacterium terreum]|uniref:Uncharacterized protein n=1 Tax=Undibacterium terreum TaxID=1224302 RepID=A0A916XQH5_9BURK|nr:hypothetical protein GCM10011396_50100 [Undibacterium terreum]
MPPSKLAIKYAPDVERMRQCLERGGYVVGKGRIVQAWADYSASAGATWLRPDALEDSLRQALLRQLSPLSADPGPCRRFIGQIVDARDGSGDGILPLPVDLVAYAGWEEGDVLRISVMAPGQLSLERVSIARGDHR